MLEDLKRLIKGVMPEVETDGVTEETRLVEDLHFDSLGIMMLAMAIETEYGIQFGDDINFATVADVIKYIQDRK
ncbi:MAG: phosphopantetheine-binding protein [Bacilli bacterium]|nr:phosphopantetheine-binding protein [Bacilli bacterium]